MNLGPYSDFFTQFPLADLPMPDIQAYLLAAPQGQVVFFNLPAGTAVPPHRHGAQWGIVVAGELEMTIGDVTKVMHAGDSYRIADQEEHGAKVIQESWVLDVFADPHRYAPKAG